MAMWKHRFSSMCQPFRDTRTELPQKQSLTNGPPDPSQAHGGLKATGRVNEEKADICMHAWA